MDLEKNLYRKGNWVVHVFYGVGQIIGKDKKILDGENLTFLKVKTADSLLGR